ncbi:unnamed protein product [Hydatigera taeniaeformis]|uniref:EF-hand domain-containing protein n=1 Tax=Hydatigena taeniaeformis TaxID=6205 RepID=A0A0R3X430_HYDTA|nr:unnamed protein product [Hydatigera taeniaeformis]
METGFLSCSASRGIKYNFTTKQKDEIKCAFDLLDEKGVGIIEIQDLAIVVRALGINLTPVDISKIIRRYDPKKTGNLDFRGFLGIVEKIMLADFADEEIVKAFQIYCQTDAECITFDDTRLIARQLNEDISEEELKELFNGADLNNDGVIDFNEFAALLKRSPYSPNQCTV